MPAAYKKTSTLRKMFDDGVSLSLKFNAGHGRSEGLATEQTNVGQANAGQVSLLGLRPYTLEEKLETLKQMIAKGKIALPVRVSLDTLKHELKKPEHDGLGVRQMVSLLKDKKLLQEHKTPAIAFRLQALTPRLML